MSLVRPITDPKSSTRMRKAELRLAHQGPNVGTDDSMANQEGLQSGLKALELLVLAAIYSPISQLSLSPIYGSIPPSQYHQQLTIAAILLAWASRRKIPSYVSRDITKFLPVLAFLIPTIHFIVFKYSGPLGPTYGPLFTELLTYFPLVFMSVLAVASLLDATGWKHYGGQVTDIMPAIASYAVFNLTQKGSSSLIKQNIGSSIVFTRSGLQFVIATFYTLILPSKIILVAILPILHSGIYNVHTPVQQTTDALNATLLTQGYSLAARQESLTGYISVLDNVKDGFRVLRCDHSLLGGEWLHRQDNSISILSEPIYAVFAMLEAVRLVETTSLEAKPVKPDSKKEALVIGLGIGTTPSALIAHGIKTTVIEIDPVVHSYATQYFNLPSNHTSIIEDAVVFVEKMQTTGAERASYDYIIHDVFTGGAEPVDLFTEEFLTNLSNMLSSDGVIAINYAGDLLSPSASLVVNTVKTVFPSCRLFREDAAPSTSSNHKPRTKDFSNMVMFCRKSSTAFTFRDPTEADCLGSQARKYHLLPKHEIAANFFEGRLRGGRPKTVKGGQTKFLEAFQRESAVGHWHIMRAVLPDAVWENW